METKTVTVSPPYSLVLLLDPVKGVAPQSMAGQLVAAAKYCVAVGCRQEDDGPTTIVLGCEHLVDPGFNPVFEGEVETPSLGLEIQTVLGVTLAATGVNSLVTRISIWVNDPIEPDKIIFGIGDD